MIPDEHVILSLWDTYDLPDIKRNHSRLVARVAMFLATQVCEKLAVPIDTTLLYAGAMLHDIDKNIQKAKGEHHPDTGVRILRERGFREVADLIKTHSLPSILDQTIAPRTWEEKLLYLSDKMVKHEVITVDERFRLWKKEELSREAKDLLDKTYPNVKKLETDVFTYIGIKPQDVERELHKCIQSVQ